MGKLAKGRNSFERVAQAVEKKKMKFFFSLVYSFVFSKMPFERQNKGVQLGCPQKKRFAEKENVGKKNKTEKTKE